MNPKIQIPNKHLIPVLQEGSSTVKSDEKEYTLKADDNLLVPKNKR